MFFSAFKAPTVKNSFVRAFSTSKANMTHTVPPLPYAYNALEPVISEKIMTLHHDKHHQTYVNNLNKAEADIAAATQANDISKQIAVQSALKFNGGGHINHSLFWESLTPQSESKEPTSGPLYEQIVKDFGSIENLKNALTAAQLGIQGSGWAFLVYSQASKSLDVVTTANQDPWLASDVILAFDNWEHSWYLQYLNDKGSYVKNVYSIVNWKTAEDRFAAKSKI